MKRRFPAKERAIIAWIERDKRRALTPHEIKFVLARARALGELSESNPDASQ